MAMARMMVAGVVVICAIVVLNTRPEAASPRAAPSDRDTPLYPDAVLARAEATYADSLRGNFADLVERLPPELEDKAREVRLVLPRRGRTPLDFYAVPGERRVYVPIESVKFLDDLVTAFAYRETRQCDPSAVFDYAGMLSSPERRVTLPPPLEALGVPANVLEARDAVYTVSGDLLKSAIYYLMAHELGHVLLRHAGYSREDPGRSQQYESEADAFALDAMTQIGVVPAGMLVYFRAAAYYENPPGDLDDRRFRAYMRLASTHPLAAQRIHGIADGVRARMEAFTRINKASAVAIVVRELGGIASQLDDVKMRNFQRVRSDQRPLASLRGCSEWVPSVPR